MRALKLVAGALFLAAFVVGAVQPAEALGITGTISFAGGGTPTGGGGTSWADATGVNFGTMAVNTDDALTQGDYDGLEGTNLGSTSFTDFTFNPFPVGGVVPLWSFTVAGTTYSFDLLDVTIDDQTANFLNLTGTGTLHIAGVINRDDTDGTFSLTGVRTQAGTLFTFSVGVVDAAISQETPEPAGIVLLGLGLLGVARTARRRS